MACAFDQSWNSAQPRAELGRELVVGPCFAPPSAVKVCRLPGVPELAYEVAGMPTGRSAHKGTETVSPLNVARFRGRTERSVSVTCDGAERRASTNQRRRLLVSPGLYCLGLTSRDRSSSLPRGYSLTRSWIWSAVAIGNVLSVDRCVGVPVKEEIVGLDAPANRGCSFVAAQRLAPAGVLLGLRLSCQRCPPSPRTQPACSRHGTY